MNQRSADRYIARQDADRFLARAEAAFGPQGNIIEHDLRFNFLIETNDFGAADSPKEIDITRRAQDYAAGNETRQSQNPLLNAGQALPGDMLIMVGAISAVAWFPTDLDPASDELAETAVNLDKSVLTLSSGANDKFYLSGDQVWSYGPNNLSGPIPEAPAVATGIVKVDRQARLLVPFIFGQAQRFDFKLLLGNVAAWPFGEDGSMEVRVNLHALVAQVS